jgi:hypothetical protein
MTTLLQRLESIDRRWIYLVILAAVVIPFLMNLKLPVGKHSPSTTAVHDYIEQLPPGSVIQMSFDYSPASMPELEPMAKAVVRHAFEKGHRILAMTLHPQGALMIRRALDEMALEMNKEYGVDYVDAGFKPGGVAVILGMGKDIVRVFEDMDARGNKLSAMPMMRDVADYSDIALMMDFAANSLPLAWVAYAHEQYGLQMGVGLTAVMATDLYPYWKSEQFVGLINGLKGAAEYEDLVEVPGLGILGMSSQSIAHLLIILFIVLGNVGYIVTGRASQRRT